MTGLTILLQRRGARHTSQTLGMSNVHTNACTENNRRLSNNQRERFGVAYLEPIYTAVEKLLHILFSFLPRRIPCITCTSRCLRRQAF